MRGRERLSLNRLSRIPLKLNRLGLSRLRLLGLSRLTLNRLGLNQRSSLVPRRRAKIDLLGRGVARGHGARPCADAGTDHDTDRATDQADERATGSTARRAAGKPPRPGAATRQQQGQTSDQNPAPHRTLLNFAGPLLPNQDRAGQAFIGHRQVGRAQAWPESTSQLQRSV